MGLVSGRMLVYTLASNGGGEMEGDGHSSFEINILSDPPEMEAGTPPVVLPPPDDGGGRDRRPRPDGPPRRNIYAFLPWIILGALVIATERISMIILAVPDLAQHWYAVAAVVFLTVALGGSLVGGIVFYRAWHAAHGPDAD